MEMSHFELFHYMRIQLNHVEMLITKRLWEKEKLTWCSDHVDGIWCLSDYILVFCGLIGIAALCYYSTCCCANRLCVETEWVSSCIVFALHMQANIAFFTVIFWDWLEYNRLNKPWLETKQYGDYVLLSDNDVDIKRILRETKKYSYD